MDNMNNGVHRQGKKYDNEEDKRKGYLEAQRRYNSKKWKCLFCNKTLSLSNKAQHLKTKIHIHNEDNYIS